MDKKPDCIPDDVWELINDPAVIRVTDAMAGYDAGEVSPYELKAIMEENRAFAPHISQRVIDMCDEEINKDV